MTLVAFKPCSSSNQTITAANYASARDHRGLALRSVITRGVKALWGLGAPAMAMTILASGAIVSASTGPTAEGALAAEQAIAQALLANDADAVGRRLADDWVVVTTHGDMSDREGFLAVIKSGAFSRKTVELSEPRVKIYGNMAVITSRLKTSGVLGGKPFDVLERQTGCTGLERW